MKKIGETLKSGLIALIPLFIAILLFRAAADWLWRTLTSRGFFGNNLLNFSVNLAIGLAAIYLVGWFFQKPWLRWLRNSMRSVLEKIPIVSIVAELVFPREGGFFGENNQDFKVVLVKLSEKTFLCGAVTNEKEVTDENGNKKVMCSVFVPTSPVPFTGFLVFTIEKSELIQTGMKLGDLTMMAASYGLKGFSMKYLTQGKTNPVK